MMGHFACKRLYLMAVLAAIIVLLGSSNVRAKLQPQEASQVFQEANVAFAQANKTQGSQADQLYEKAILGYKRLVEEGEIRNAKLYTNLGNSYLLTNDIGNSVLWYGRALRLEPGNPEIARNLAFARSKRLDKVEPPAQKRVMQTLLFWHYDVSARTRFAIASISMGVLCVLLSIAIWIGRRAWLTAGACIAGILLVAMAGSLVFEQVTTDRGGVIISGEVVARQGDGTNYPEAFKEPLHAGTEFTLLERRPGWIKLELADASRAWVPAESVELF
jgi:hypothetical protein